MKEWEVSERAATGGCGGIHIRFPEGETHHTSYPFGIHAERSIPWDYRSTGDSFYIQAKSCQKPFKEGRGACETCRKLTSNSPYLGIVQRVNHGVRENAPLVYHGVDGIVTIIRRKMEQTEELRADLELPSILPSDNALGRQNFAGTHRQ